METQNKTNEIHKQLVEKVLLNLTEEQKEYICYAYLDDETDEDLKGRVKTQ